MRNLFNLKNLFSSIHNGNFVNGLTNYGVIGALLALDVFGLVLAFKSSVVLGLITLITGPAFVVSMFAIGGRYGYNFWNKFMPMVSATSSLAYYMVVGGMVGFLFSEFGHVFNSLLVDFAVIAGVFVFAIWLFEYVKASLYETTFMVFFALCPMGFIFGLMQWWMGFNLASYLVNLFH